MICQNFKSRDDGRRMWTGGSARCSHNTRWIVRSVFFFVFSMFYSFFCEEGCLVIGETPSTNVKLKAKAVPQHAPKVLGGDSVAPTHSQPRHWMGVSSQRHAPAALYPRGKDLRYALHRRLGGPQSRSVHRGKRKNPFASAGDRTSISRSCSTHVVMINSYKTVIVKPSHSTSFMPL
jgi:hypothetical protein